MSEISLNLSKLLIGLILSLAIGVTGCWRGVLAIGGVVGAVVTGTLMFGLGGWAWGTLLIAFFISSSVLSFYRAHEKETLAEKFAKGLRRDMGQALANGGLATLLAVLSWARPALLWFFAAAGAMAAVNADTWATELGVLSTRPPRLITTGQRVEVGTSGGVTGLGFLASLGGALFIGLLGGLTLLTDRGWLTASALTLAATLGGLSGAAFDSLLGATVQATYWCDTCQKETERQVHRCGARTHLMRGWRWLGNDLVNFIASVVGALTATGIGWRML